jgi:hypothetical protein
MTSPIDPIRKTALVRRAQRPYGDDADEVGEAEDRSVPVVLDGPPRTPPGGGAQGASAFDAHLMGQGGQKRGLRGGPETLGAAKSAYVSTEWSGRADRRARKGRITKTEI